MGDVNPIRTLEDYSKPSHEGYKNTIELPDPNKHLKDFLKLVDSHDVDGENRESTCLRLFQFSLCDQASNWLECLPARSITTWEDLTTRFLAQFFPPGRTAKLHNDILMFQQHHGESLSEAWTRFKDLLQKRPSSWHRSLAPRNPATQMNFTLTNTPKKRSFRQGFKSPSKLLSLKYLSQSSLAEQNRNPSSLKRIHFVNSIVILNKEDEAKEEGNVKSSTTEYEDHEMNVESEEEFEEEVVEEIKEE
ncbi:zinc finger, CCHC-type containing protein [Tanacetum coccineum]